MRIGVRQWGHVLAGHPEMLGYLEEVVNTIERPEHREPDPAAGRERFFRREGPERWIRVVVEFSGEVNRLITAFPQTSDPGGWER